MTSIARSTLALAGLALVWAMPANAQTPTPTPAMRATILARHISRITGSVTATPKGAGTMVTVRFRGPLPTGPEALTLMSGADCTDVLQHSARSIALNPPQGPVSSTLIAIPFSAFTSGSYVVDIRNATARANQADACARF
jgi:hypothetical protein